MDQDGVFKTHTAWCIVCWWKTKTQVYSLPWKWWSVLINSPGVIFKSLGCSSCACRRLCAPKDQHGSFWNVCFPRNIGCVYTICIHLLNPILYNWLAFISSKFFLMPSEFHGTLPRSICPTVTFSLSYSWIIQFLEQSKLINKDSKR